MTKEETDKLINLLDKYRGDYIGVCERRRAAEQGKIEGANYMFAKLLMLMGAERNDSDESNTESEE